MILPQVGIILRETSFREIVFLGYEFGKNHTSINHLLFLEDLKLFAKSKKQLNTLINTVRIFSEDKRMEFDISKYGAVIMRKGKFSHSDEIYLPSGETIHEVDQEKRSHIKITYLECLKVMKSSIM